VALCACLGVCRYQLDVDLKSLVTMDKLDNSTKKEETRKVWANLEGVLHLQVQVLWSRVFPYYSAPLHMHGCAVSHHCFKSERLARVIWQTLVCAVLPPACVHCRS